MRSDDFFYLGKVTKVVGLKGELSVYLDTDEPEKYYSMESVFLAQQEELVPFFVTSIKVKNRQQVVVQFQDVDAGTAPSLVDAELYLPLSMLPPLTGNRFYYHEIKGFEIVDENQQSVGVCTGVLEYPHQSLFQIDHQGIEVLGSRGRLVWEGSQADHLWQVISYSYRSNRLKTIRNRYGDVDFRTFFLKYDEWGNWVEKAEYDGINLQVTTREITYGDQPLNMKKTAPSKQSPAQR